MLKNNISYKVQGYTNKWSVIDNYKGYALLENETYGDETCYLVVEENVEVIDKKYIKKSTGEKITIPTITKIIEEIFDDFRGIVDEVYTYVPYDIL